MPSTHTADFQTAALKATDLEAVEKINVGLETELARKQLNIIADAPEIRIQDKTGSASETTMSIVADGGATHFRAGIDTFAEGTETKGNVKFQSSTGATDARRNRGEFGEARITGRRTRAQARVERVRDGHVQCHPGNHGTSRT
jgi:hypothetical protein